VKTITEKLSRRASDIFNDADLMREAQSAIEQLKATVRRLLATTPSGTPGQDSFIKAQLDAMRFLSELEGKA
jgi:hypothetical protein